MRSELLDARRVRPIVAVTTHPSSGRFLIEPHALEERVGQWADVVAFETGEATWELADALPDRLDVYGGAMRVWWPVLQRESDPYDHMLYLIRSARRRRGGWPIWRATCGAGRGPVEAPDTSLRPGRPGRRAGPWRWGARSSRSP